MSRRANPALIGAFVLGALALLVAGLLVLGGGRLSGERETLVLYFRDSTSGLTVGAPVVLKGVQVGIVKRIEVIYDEEAGSFLVPVYIDIEQDKIAWPGEIRAGLDSRELYEKALASGLRAMLSTQSLVTGMLQIEIGFFPGTALILHQRDDRYRELPTIPSALERLRGQIEDIPLEHLVNEAVATLEGLNRLVNAPDVPRILANLEAATADISRAAQALRERVGSSGDRLDATLDQLREVAGMLSARLEGLMVAGEQAAAEVSHLARDANREIESLADSLRRAGDAAQAAFGSAEGALDSVSSAVGEGSPLRREVLVALQSLSAAARSLRDLADYLERHPEALLSGKR